MSQGVFEAGKGLIKEQVFGLSPYRLFTTIIPEPVLKKKVSPVRFIVLSFLVIIFLGSLFLSSSLAHNEGKDVNYIDALFTATSATTVTGLVVVDTADTYNWFGQVIILVLISLGGLGYMTILSFFFMGSKFMPLRQATFVKEQLNLPSIGDILTLAKRVFLTVAVFEFAGAFILTMFWWQSVDFFSAVWRGIFHSVSAFNNAGFDLMGSFRGLTEYVSNPLVSIVIMILIVAGGLGFFVISDLISFATGVKRTGFSLHTKIVLSTSLILIIAGAIFIYSFESNNRDTIYPLDFGDKVLASTFHSVSARTAGFNTLDMGKLTIPTLLILIILMFIGASPGGTGGGVKTTTFSIAVLSFFALLKQKEGAEAFNRRISTEAVEKSFILIMFSLLIVFSATLIMTYVDDFPLHKILFETFSAFGTVGLSTGITAQLSDLSKWVIMILMYIGRIGPLTLISMITWAHRSKVNYLEEQVTVG